MSTCPDCGADYRAPLNYLNKPCCARARDAEVDKRSMTLSTLGAPPNPGEGDNYAGQDGQFLRFEGGKWRPLTASEAVAHAEDEMAVMTAEFVNRIQRAMIGSIEQIEGRVPSNGEVKEHGACRLRTTESGERQEIYYWKGQPIYVARFCVRRGNSMAHVLEPAAKHPDILPIS